MLLAIDIGNSNITLGVVRDGNVAGKRRAVTPRRTTPDEMQLLLEAASSGWTACACATSTVS